MRREKYFSSENNPRYIHEIMYANDYPASYYNTNVVSLEDNIKSISKEEINSFFNNIDLIDDNDWVEPLSQNEIDIFFNNDDELENVISITNEEIDNLFN